LDLFGKKKLEDHIQEMESYLAQMQDDKDELMRTLEKREDKIRKLTSAYQEANLALKLAQQKTASPSVSIPAAPSEEEMHKLVGLKLSLREMEKMQKRLQACRSPEDDLLNAYISDLGCIPPDLKKAVESVKSDTGWIVFQSPQLFTLLLVPPFPIMESSTNLDSIFHLDLLREMIETPVLVVSAHAGETFLGVALDKEGFQAKEFVESPVKEKHSKGGWSQKRFERLREEDIKNHIDTVLEKLSELMGKYRSLVRFAVLGGDENMLKQIAPAVGLPVIARRLDRLNEQKPEQLLEEVYGFTCYHI
jgi:hypothetical protein